MWRLLEPAYRSWLRYYGLALVLAVAAAGICSLVFGFEASVTVLVGTGLTLGLWWALGAARRAFDRREGREALYLKTTVPIGAMARARVTEGALPLLAATVLGLLCMVPALLWGEEAGITIWHLATVGAAILAFDQLTVLLEEVQILFVGRGRLWLGRAISIGVGALSGAAGTAFGLHAARAEGEWFGPFRDVTWLPVVGLLVLALVLTIAAHVVFLRREYTALKI